MCPRVARWLIALCLCVCLAKELMILGLIAFGLKVLKEVHAIDAYAKGPVAFQVADLTVFILAIALIVQASCVFFQRTSSCKRPT